MITKFLEKLGIKWQNAIWLVIPMLVQFILAFLCMILYTHMLPQETYGYYKYFMAILFGFAFFSLQGMASALLKSTSDNYEMLTQTAKWSVWAGLSGSIVLVIWGLLTNIKEIQIFFFIGAVLFPFLFSLQNLTCSYLSGKHLYKEAGYFDLLRISIQIVPQIIIIFITKELFWLMLVFMLAQALGNIIPYEIVKRKYDGSLKFDNSTFKLGLKLSFMEVLTVVADQADKLLIAAFMNFSDVAAWVVCVGIASLLYQLRPVVNKLFMPKISQMNFEEGYYWIKKRIGLFVVLSLIATTIGAFLIRPIMMAVFPISYYPIILYTQILFFGYSFFIVKEIACSYLTYYEKVKSLYKLNIISNAIRLLAFIVFIPLFGISGAIISYAIYNSFYYVYAYHLMKKEYLVMKNA